jgi:hypothetical protein
VPALALGALAVAVDPDRGEIGVEVAERGALIAER